MPNTGEKSPEEWRSIVDQYERLRDLERPDFLHALQQMIGILRRDAATLYRAAIRLEIRASAGEVIALSDLGADGVRRRLTTRGHGAGHLRFTEGFLDRLAPQVTLHPDPLRTQAWWLDVAAENTAVWIEIYLGRQQDLRQHTRGRPRSVGLDFLIGQTLGCRLSEVARRLVDARVLPERESDHDDLLAQWKQALKRARTRYRRRGAR